MAALAGRMIHLRRVLVPRPFVKDVLRIGPRTRCWVPELVSRTLVDDGYRSAAVGPEVAHYLFMRTTWQCLAGPLQGWPERSDVAHKLTRLEAFEVASLVKHPANLGRSDELLWRTCD